MEFLQGQRLETTLAVAAAVVAVAAGSAYLFLRSRKPRGESPLHFPSPMTRARVIRLRVCTHLWLWMAESFCAGVLLS